MLKRKARSAIIGDFLSLLPAFVITKMIKNAKNPATITAKQCAQGALKDR